MMENFQDQMNKLSKYCNLRVSVKEVVEAFSIDLEVLRKETFSEFIKILAKKIYDSEVSIFDNIEIAIKTDDVDSIKDNALLVVGGQNAPDNIIDFLNVLLDGFEKFEIDDKFKILYICILVKHGVNQYQAKYDDFKMNFAVPDIFNKIKDLFRIDTVFKKICLFNCWHKKLSQIIGYDKISAITFNCESCENRSVFEIFCLYFQDHPNVKIFPSQTWVNPQNNNIFFSSDIKDLKFYNSKASSQIGDSSSVTKKPSSNESDFIAIFKYPFLYTDNKGQYSIATIYEDVKVMAYVQVSRQQA